MVVEERVRERLAGYSGRLDLAFFCVHQLPLVAVAVNEPGLHENIDLPFFEYNSLGFLWVVWLMHRQKT